MRPVLFLLVLAAGCQAPPGPVAVVPAAPRSCPGPVASPLPPPKPRTVESIADWGNRTTVALETANARLAECSALVKDR